MAFLENFIPVTILTSLSLSLLFSSFFPTKPQIPKRSLFLVIYLTCVPYYFINNLANESGTGSLRPILTTLSTLLLLLCVQAFLMVKLIKEDWLLSYLLFFRLSVKEFC